MICCVNLILLQRDNINVSFSYQKKTGTGATSWMPHVFDNKGLLIHPESQTPEKKTKICVISTLLSVFSLESTDPV